LAHRSKGTEIMSVDVHRQVKNGPLGLARTIGKTPAPGNGEPDAGIVDSLGRNSSWLFLRAIVQ